MSAATAHPFSEPARMPTPAELRASIFGHEPQAVAARRMQQRPATTGNPKTLGKRDFFMIGGILVAGSSLTVLGLTYRAELYFLWLLIEELCS